MRDENNDRASHQRRIGQYASAGFDLAIIRQHHVVGQGLFQQGMSLRCGEWSDHQENGDRYDVLYTGDLRRPRLAALSGSHDESPRLCRGLVTFISGALGPIVARRITAIISPCRCIAYPKIVSAPIVAWPDTHAVSIVNSFRLKESRRAVPAI